MDDDDCYVTLLGDRIDLGGVKILELIDRLQHDVSNHCVEHEASLESNDIEKVEKSKGSKEADLLGGLREEARKQATYLKHAIEEISWLRERNEELQTRDFELNNLCTKYESDLAEKVDMIKEENAKLEAKEKEVEDLKDILEQRIIEENNAKMLLDIQDMEYSSKLAERDEYILAQESAIENLQQVVDQLEYEVHEANEAIEEHRLEVNKAEEQLKESWDKEERLERENRDLLEKIGSIKEKSKILQESLVVIENDLREKEETISILAGQKNALESDKVWEIEKILEKTKSLSVDLKDEIFKFKDDNTDQPPVIDYSLATGHNTEAVNYRVDELTGKQSEEMLSLKGLIHQKDTEIKKLMENNIAITEKLRCLSGNIKETDQCGVIEETNTISLIEINDNITCNTLKNEEKNSINKSSVSNTEIGICAESERPSSVCLAIRNDIEAAEDESLEIYSAEESFHMVSDIDMDSREDSELIANSADCKSRGFKNTELQTGTGICGDDNQENCKSENEIEIQTVEITFLAEKDFKEDSELLIDPGMNKVDYSENTEFTTGNGIYVNDIQENGKAEVLTEIQTVEISFLADENSSDADSDERVLLEGIVNEEGTVDGAAEVSETFVVTFTTEDDNRTSVAKMENIKTHKGGFHDGMRTVRLTSNAQPVEEGSGEFCDGNIEISESEIQHLSISFDSDKESSDEGSVTEYDITEDRDHSWSKRVTDEALCQEEPKSLSGFSGLPELSSYEKKRKENSNLNNDSLPGLYTKEDIQIEDVDDKMKVNFDKITEEIECHDREDEIREIRLIDAQLMLKKMERVSDSSESELDFFAQATDENDGDLSGGKVKYAVQIEGETEGDEIEIEVEEEESLYQETMHYVYSACDETEDIEEDLLDYSKDYHDRMSKFITIEKQEQRAVKENSDEEQAEDIAEYSQMISNLQKEIKDLKADNERLIAENNDIKAENMDVQKEASDLRGVIASQDDVIKAAKVREDYLVKVTEQGREEITDLENKIALEVSRNKIASKCQDCQKLSAETAEQRLKIGEIDEELTRTKAELERVRKDLDEMKQNNNNPPEVIIAHADDYSKKKSKKRSLFCA